jgi:four helix bundle protein
MEYIYSFEKLDVWQEARRLVKEIYIASDLFPSNEKYGLTNQIRRASVSVVSNIAEGVSRFSPKEQIRFIEIAYGSLTEVYCQLIIAVDLDYLSSDKLESIKLRILKISNQLNSLKKSISKRADGGSSDAK